MPGLRLVPHVSNGVLVALAVLLSPLLAASASTGATGATGSGEYGPAEEARATQAIRELLSAQVLDAFRKNGPPAKRDAHAKAQGCVEAHFRVLAAVPAALRQGIFAHAHTYTAWIRFSNAAGTDDHRGLAHGMALKLLGVPGRKVLPSEATATTQDFLVVNYPVFNIRTPADYVEFFKASQAGTLPAFFTKHPAAGALTAAIGAQRVDNPLLTRYFSMTPYELGPGAVKYSARPVDCATGAKLQASDAPPPPGPNYLRAAMIASLEAGASCFRFEVQPRTDPARMPIDDATVEWSEAASPFVPVASIDIPKQRFDSAAQQRFCENLSYTPWHALPADRPLGVINRIRRVVYDAISILRHRLNGVPRREPTGNERFEGSPTW